MFVLLFHVVFHVFLVVVEVCVLLGKWAVKLLRSGSVNGAFELGGFKSCRGRGKSGVRIVFLGFGFLDLLFQEEVLVEEVFVEAHGVVEAHVVEVLFEVVFWMHSQVRMRLIWLDVI